MNLQFPDATITVTTDIGSVLLRACEICGAAVLEAEDTDYALHLRWHEKTGTQNWYDPATHQVRGPARQE